MVVLKIIHAVLTLVVSVFLVHVIIKKLGCKKGLNAFLPAKYLFISLALLLIFFAISEKIILPVFQLIFTNLS